MTPELIIKNFKQDKEYFINFTNKNTLSICVVIDSVVFMSDWFPIRAFHDRIEIMDSKVWEVGLDVFRLICEQHKVFKISLECLKEPKNILKDFPEYFI